MIPRRALIAAAAAGLLRSPLAAAQTGGKKPRIGLLSPSVLSPSTEGFLRGLPPSVLGRANKVIP